MLAILQSCLAADVGTSGRLAVVALDEKLVAFLFVHPAHQWSVARYATSVKQELVRVSPRGHDQ